MSCAIAIDLGNKHIRIGTYENGVFSVMESESGQQKIPTTISFLKQRTIAIGEQAERQSVIFSLGIKVYCRLMEFKPIRAQYNFTNLLELLDLSISAAPRSHMVYSIKN